MNRGDGSCGRACASLQETLLVLLDVSMGKESCAARHLEARKSEATNLCGVQQSSMWPRRYAATYEAVLRA